MSSRAARLSTFIASFALLAFWWAAIVGPPGLVEQVASDVLRSPQGQHEVAEFVASTMVKAGFDEDRASVLAHQAVKDPKLVQVLEHGAGTTRVARTEEAVRAVTSSMPTSDADAVARTLTPLLKSASGWGDKLGAGPLPLQSIHAVLLWVYRVGFGLAGALAVIAFAVGPRRGVAARRVGRWALRASWLPVGLLVAGPLVLDLLPFEWTCLGAVALRSAAGILGGPLLGLFCFGIVARSVAFALKRARARRQA